MTSEEASKIAIIKRIILGNIITEYALMELTGLEQDLKQRVNGAIAASRKVQNWFKYHPNSQIKHLEDFKSEFLHNNLVLIGEAANLLWQYPEAELENIIAQLKDYLQPAEETVQ